MSKPPEETLATLRDAAWPPSRIGEALTLFALRLGLQRPEEGVVPPQEVSEEQFPTWLEAAATRTGVQADQVFNTLMGDRVEPRRLFIESHALEVRNLDI